MILGPKSKSYKDSLKIRFLETIFTSETGILSGIKSVGHPQVMYHFYNLINKEFAMFIIISLISIYGLDLTRFIDTSSSRILIGSYKIGYLIVIWCLISIYGADLIIGTRKIIIDSYRDIAKRTDVIPIIPVGGTNLEIYKSADPYSRAGRIWKRRLIDYKNISKEVIIDQVIKQQYAIVDNEDRLDSTFMRICAKNDTINPKLWISRETFFVSNFAMAVSYKMSYSKVRRLDRIIRDIVSSGLINRW